MDLIYLSIAHHQVFFFFLQTFPFSKKKFIRKVWHVLRVLCLLHLKYRTHKVNGSIMPRDYDILDSQALTNYKESQVFFSLPEKIRRYDGF